jgi:CheY-like chemotaxis protein
MLRKLDVAIDVLVVDDHESMRRIIQELLKAFGLPHTREAGDGEAALRLLAEKPADVIITDLKMPRMDGIAFALKLRADDDPRLAEIPMIMVTGHANASRVIAARNAGLNEFIVKPIRGAVLADRLRRLVEEDRVFIRAQDYIGPDRRRRTVPGYKGPFRRAADGAAAVAAVAGR